MKALPLARKPPLSVRIAANRSKQLRLNRFFFIYLLATKSKSGAKIIIIVEIITIIRYKKVYC